MKCEIKFFNERNPCCQLPACKDGDSDRTAGDKSEEGGDDVKSSLGTQAELPATSRRKVGMTSSHHGPYVLGHTRATMAGTERSEAGTRSESQKAGLSTDCSLQLDCMKMESLVIAHQHGAVNMFPGLVHTARHTIRVGGTRSRQPDRKGGGSEGTSGEGGEVVTR